MNTILSRTVSALGFCLALGLGNVAHAATVHYSFKVTIDFSAAPEVAVNDVFAGAFSYDDATFSEDPINFPGEKFYPLSSFSFNFNGVSYGLADLFTGDAVTDSGAFAGLDANGPGFSFVPDAVNPFFTFQIGRFGGTGAVANALAPAPVPEPGTLMLAAAALALAATRRRVAALPTSED